MEEASLLRSHIVPPSHILANGQFVHLPPPSAYERSTFFERSVAEHGLIHVGDDTDIDGNSSRNKREDQKKKKKTKRQGGGDDVDDHVVVSSQTTSRHAKRKKQSSSSGMHPLAIASARLRSKGLEELNKAINLSGLVIGGEYIGLTHVVDHQQPRQRPLITNKKESPTSSKGGEDNGNMGGTIGVADQSFNGCGGRSKGISNLVNETLLQEDLRLRSEYVLQRRQSQYDNASNVLLRHSKRLSISVGVSRIIDNRLQTLRHKWHLVAPEHGKRNVGPIQPREVVAVDVDIYDRGLRDGRSRGEHSSLGRIARRVPRFATLELDEEYDVLSDVTSLRTKLGDVIRSLREVKDDEDEGDGDRNDVLEDMQVDSIDENGSKDHSSSSRSAQTCKTKAEPFAIADPALGKVDPDFDPDKVPLLTLSFEIEKPSTGFVERATLSSSIGSLSSSSTSNGFLGNDSGIQQHVMHPDERVIEALQHSLFCASLFESIRTEIIPSVTTPMVGAEMSISHSRQKSAAWLSSEMEESFLPPPSVMAGGEDTNQIEDTRLLCVIHCHEGEVKVQLDDEYSLTVKLIEAGTTVAAGAQHDRSDAGIDADMNPCNSFCSGIGSSGSQSPAHLRTLCRAMLLQSQSLYHDHCMMLKRIHASAPHVKDETPAVGFARMTKETKLPSPHILKRCVGLGCKFIFERKVRSVIQRLAMWLENDMQCREALTVEWFSMSLFTPYSQFALLFRELCLDVVINGDALRVTQMSKHGFKAVGFGSDIELECYLKLEFRRAIARD